MIANNMAWRGGVVLAFAVNMLAGFAAPAGAATEAVLYSFAGGNDGSFPNASLIYGLGSKLYGTTEIGGGVNCAFSNMGCGTVFSVTLSGAEKVMHAFGNGNDGEAPNAGMSNLSGLYGTTPWGGGTACAFGANGCGTVFSFNETTGAEKVLYAFCSQANCSDGAAPFASLTYDNGLMYGTTAGGGAGNCADGCGTVFSINTKTGAEKVVYAFKGGNDGAFPYASLLNIKGILYGTTTQGGTGTCPLNTSGCGTVFSINPTTGVETVLYSFQGGNNDGWYPSAGLIDAGGTLYGTTLYGNGANCASSCGTVFSINPTTGAEKVLHAFQGGNDGWLPAAGLIYFRTLLYGATEDGGANNAGTVFSVNPSTGAESVVWSFGGGTDGVGPAAALIHVGNTTLYGTTTGGGTSGHGTVFSLTF